MLFVYANVNYNLMETSSLFFYIIEHERQINMLM